MLRKLRVERYIKCSVLTGKAIACVLEKEPCSHDLMPPERSQEKDRIDLQYHIKHRIL